MEPNRSLPNWVIVMLVGLPTLCMFAVATVDEKKLMQVKRERDVYQTALTHLMHKRSVTTEHDRPLYSSLDPAIDGIGFDIRTNSFVIAPLESCDNAWPCRQKDTEWYLAEDLPRIELIDDVATLLPIEEVTVRLDKHWAMSSTDNNQ